MIVGLIHESVYDYSQYKKDDFINILDLIEESKPKKHTIREDKKDRWQFGYLIDFFINTRTVNMFRFAPRINVTNIQKIEIRYNKGGGVNVFIDKKFFYYQTSFGLEWDKETKNKMLQLVQNDGFETIQDFLNYFNTDFTGKLIHWTDFKY
jgi:hypothetical protein